MEAITIAAITVVTLLFIFGGGTCLFLIIKGILLLSNHTEKRKIARLKKAGYTPDQIDEFLVNEHRYDYIH